MVVLTFPRAGAWIALECRSSLQADEDRHKKHVRLKLPLHERKVSGRIDMEVIQRHCGDRVLAADVPCLENDPAQNFEVLKEIDTNPFGIDIPLRHTMEAMLPFVEQAAA